MTRIPCPTCHASGHIIPPHGGPTLRCGTCQGDKYGTRFDAEGVLVNDDWWRDRCKRFAFLAEKLLDAQRDSRMEYDTLAALDTLVKQVRAKQARMAGEAALEREVQQELLLEV